MFISASAGPIFASKMLTAMLVASALSFIAYYAILRKAGPRIDTRRRVAWFFLFWLAALTFEFYFLGPYSFVEQTTEGNLNVAFGYYLTHGHDGGRFSHRYGGGQDVYTLLFGMHFFNPERFFLAAFPLWIAIFLHKIMVGAIGFVGTYLLARRVAPEHRMAAAAIGALFTVSHSYLLNWSTNWSPGFAVLPLVIHLCVARSGGDRYWPGVFIAALVLTPADPIHVFPALAVAVIGAVIIMDDINLKRVALSLLLLVLCSVANWHEVIYAFHQNVGLTVRMQFGGPNAYWFLDTAWQSVRSVAITMPLVAFFYALSLLVLAFRRDRLFKRAFATLAWSLMSLPLVATFPWHWVGLGVLGRLSNNYLLMSLLGILPLVLARTLAVVGIAGSVVAAPPRWPRPVAALLAAALAMLTWNKLLDLGLLVWFGGQGNMIAYETLKRDDWKPKEDFRVATMFDTPNANIVAGMYGLDVFDGQMNMAHIAWDDYWKSIVHRDPTHILTTRIGSKWQYWDGRAYDVERHLRLDLLGIANVRFLLSAMPLKGEGLRAVVVPAAGEQAKQRPESFPSQFDFFKFRLRRVFDPGRHYVYELPRFLPRVFAATGVEVAPPGMDGMSLHDRVAASAFRGIVTVGANDAGAFDGLGKLNVLRFRRIIDGYDIVVDAPAGGILVINNMFVPFWRATAGDERRLKAVPANAAMHTAIAVPPGVKDIRILYRRPLLRERIAELIRGLGGANL